MNRSATSPRVRTVPPGIPFLPSLAHDLLERFGADDPLALARVTIFLPTRRAVRELREELRRQTEARGQAALLLPEIYALGDVDEDELLLSLPRGAADTDILPPAIGEVRRQVLLAQLIERWSRDRHRAGDAFAIMAPPQAMTLATELAHLLDRLHTEDASLDRLADLAPAEHSGHWEMTVAFLSILSRHWPEIVRGEGAIDPGERRTRLLRALAGKWRKAPPHHPVIAAGSTGSVPATSDLLHVISRLPRGEVWLPGLDLDLDEESWALLDPPHPQYGLKLLLLRLGIKRDEISVRESEDLPAARARLWSAVFRPAATTDAWPELAPSAATKEALSDLYRIDADDSAQEAGIIACILRQTLETPGRTAALVTPDRDLARRVSVELRRWHIDIDDSAGQPLSGTRGGIFLRCLLDAVATRFAPVALLSLLKHELCRLRMAPDEKRAAIPVLERAVLRGLKPAPGLAPLRERLERAQERGHGGLAGALALLERLEAAVTPLTRLAQAGKAPLWELARAHLDAADALAGTNEGESWGGGDGEMARAFLDDLTAQEDGPEWSLPDYAAAITRCLQGRTLHARRPGHPRLFIWGPLEARLQHTDVIILGGLNEGTWPASPAPDPWLNRRMQRELGLPDPDRRVGQAAHDFTQLASTDEVYLTRSSRVEGVPQLPSRWLLRLDAVLESAGINPKTLAPSLPLAEIFHRLDRRRKRVRIADPRPAPPVKARPMQLPVTSVETLVRDPYAVYARYVLNLRALNPLEAEPGPGERGAFVHDALRRFVERFPDGLPADRNIAREALFKEGEAALKRAIGPAWVYPLAHGFWRARFEAAAEWFLEWEYERRSTGTAPVLLEAKGALQLDVGNGFTLTARADRIDCLSGGGHAIVDYKTGRAPTDREVGAGFAPQLPLEGAILQAGGFEGADAGRADALLYITLGGGRKPGEERPITGGEGSADACVAAALAGLNSLIAQYHDPSTPFLSRPHVRFLAQRSDYDHLARIKEWSAVGEEAGE